MIFQLTILGSHSAYPSRGKHPSAQLLAVDGDLFLIDCGEGTQFRLLENHSRVGKLKGIFISHLHGDHYFGLLGLLNTLSLNGRTEPLLLFGPFGLNEIITETFRHSQTVLSYPLSFVGLDPANTGMIWENEHITVHSIPLQHRIPCTGFLFREKSDLLKIRKDKLRPNMDFRQIQSLKDGKDVYDAYGEILYHAADYTIKPSPPKSYAYCSDTAYFPELAAYIDGVTVLYHEATFRDDLSDKAGEHFHSTARQAATVARDGKVNKLLIGHLSSRYTDSTPSVDEAKTVFANTIFAEEGMTLDI